MRRILNKELAIKTLSFFYKVGAMTVGVTAAIEPASAIVAGVIATAAAISSSIKDRNLKKLGPIVNILALNIGNAKNDSMENWGVGK